MARTARTRTRARVAVPVALALTLAPTLAACSDDSAGPETGADVEDVVEEEPTEDEALVEEEPSEDEGAVEDEALVEDEGAVGGTFQEQSESLVGQSVTVSGTVTEIVSDSAIRIGEATDDSLLVLGVSAPLADLGLDPFDETLVEDERIVQVTGTVRRYDPVEFTEEFGEDFEGLYDDSEGENVIVADNVDTLTGEEVTVAGEVSEVVSDVAFRLAGVGWDVLILDAAQAAAEEGEAVQVMGTVRRFEILTIEEEFGTDLDDELYTDFEGQLVLVADSIDPIELEQ